MNRIQGGSFRDLGGLKSSVVEDREGDVDENLKNGPGAAAKKRRASPEIHGPCLGQQQYNAALSPGGLLNYSWGALGWLKTPHRKTRAPKRGALEIDPLGRGPPK